MMSASPGSWESVIFSEKLKIKAESKYLIALILTYEDVISRLDLKALEASNLTKLMAGASKSLV